MVMSLGHLHIGRHHPDFSLRNRRRIRIAALHRERLHQEHHHDRTARSLPAEPVLRLALLGVTRGYGLLPSAGRSELLRCLAEGFALGKFLHVVAEGLLAGSVFHHIVPVLFLRPCLIPSGPIFPGSPDAPAMTAPPEDFLISPPDPFPQWQDRPLQQGRELSQFPRPRPGQPVQPEVTPSGSLEWCARGRS